MSLINKKRLTNEEKNRCYAKLEVANILSMKEISRKQCPCVIGSRTEARIKSFFT